MNATPLAKKLASVLLLIAAPLIMMAQQKTITGKVTGENGSAVSGASVLAKGTKAGTQTAADGTFSLSVPDNATKLVISSVGFAEKVVSLNGQTSVSVTLAASSDQMSDVVVIGYGSARKKDLTGSVATVTAKDFNKGTNTAPEQLIQGKVAGVQVVNNSGAPGG